MILYRSEESCFNNQFSEKRKKPGLQSMFYRLLDKYEVKSVRTRNRLGSPRGMVAQYGMVQRTSKRFGWMRSEHYDAPALPEFSGEPHSPSIETCSGCTEWGSG